MCITVWAANCSLEFRSLTASWRPGSVSGEAREETVPSCSELQRTEHDPTSEPSPETQPPKGASKTCKIFLLSSCFSHSCSLFEFRNKTKGSVHTWAPSFSSQDAPLGHGSLISCLLFLTASPDVQLVVSA